MMNLTTQFRFFFTTYHSGVFNIVMHVFSLAMHFLVAWPSKSVPLVIVAFLLEEVGHWYDYFFRFGKGDKRRSIEILPFKLVLVAIFCFYMARWYHWF